MTMASFTVRNVQYAVFNLGMTEEVILANGVPAETYVDHVGRRAFDNHAEYVALYGDEPQIEEMDMVRISAARLVPAEIKARIDARRPGAAA